VKLYCVINYSTRWLYNIHEHTNKMAVLIFVCNVNISSRLRQVFPIKDQTTRRCLVKIYALITPWRLVAATNENKWMQEWEEAVDWFHIQVRDGNFIQRNFLPVLESYIGPKIAQLLCKSLLNNSMLCLYCFINVKLLNFSVIICVELFQ